MLRPRAPSLRVRALLALSGLLLPHAASGVKQSTILNQRRLLLGRVLHAPADDTVALSDGRSLRREHAIRARAVGCGIGPVTCATSLSCQRARRLHQSAACT